MTREHGRRSVCREIRTAPVPTCRVYKHTPCLLMIPCHRTSPRAILGRLALLVFSQAKPSCLFNSNLTRTSQGTHVTNNIVFCVSTFIVSSNFQSSTKTMRVCCVRFHIPETALVLFASAYSWWWAIAGKSATSSAYNTPGSHPEI